MTESNGPCGMTRVEEPDSTGEGSMTGPEDPHRHLTLEEAQAEARRCLATAVCGDCEICRLLCPDQAITRDSSTHRIVIDLDYCKACGLCAHVCPRKAIRMVTEWAEEQAQT